MTSPGEADEGFDLPGVPEDPEARPSSGLSIERPSSRMSISQDMQVRDVENADFKTPRPDVAAATLASAVQVQTETDHLDSLLASLAGASADGSLAAALSEEVSATGAIIPPGSVTATIVDGRAATSGTGVLAAIPGDDGASTAARGMEVPPPALETQGSVANRSGLPLPSAQLEPPTAKPRAPPVPPQVPPQRVATTGGHTPDEVPTPVAANVRAVERSLEQAEASDAVGNPAVSEAKGKAIDAFEQALRDGSLQKIVASLDVSATTAVANASTQEIGDTGAGVGVRELTNRLTDAGQASAIVEPPGKAVGAGGDDGGDAGWNAIQAAMAFGAVERKNDQNGYDDDYGDDAELIAKARTGLGYGRFKTDARQTESEYIWVPKRYLEDLGPDFIEKVMKHWRLPKPNLVLRFESGFAHPLHLLGHESLKGAFNLNEDPKFRSLLTMIEETDDEKDKLLSINLILKRLTFQIIKTIVQVATQQNLWIVVQGRPSGITLLLEEALHNAKCTVLVVDCPMAKINTRTSIKLASYLRQLNHIVGKTEEETEQRREDIIATCAATAAAARLLNRSILLNKKPIEGGIAEPFRLDASFWKDLPKKGWFQQSADDPGAEKVRWNQWSFRSGTHYLFIDSESASDFDVGLFGPKGSVYLGGGNSTKEKIIESIRVGEPTVLIHHTGRATQQLAILHDKLKDYSDGGGPKAGKEVAWIQELSQKCAYEKEGSVVDLADIVAIDQLYKQRATIIDQTCVTLDPLDKSANEKNVLSMVSGCFAANYRISTSVAYEAASRRAVAAAWQMHAQLTSSCKWQKVMMDISLHTVLLMGFLALVCTTIILETEREGILTWKNDMFLEVLTWLVIILPAASGLITTISSRMRFRETWGLMKSASCMIEAEIFKFRVRVRRYAVVGTAGAGDDRQLREKMIRDHFTARVQQIFEAHLVDIGGASLKPTLKLSEVPRYAEAASVLSLGYQGGFNSSRKERKATRSINKALEKHEEAAFSAKTLKDQKEKKQRAKEQAKEMAKAEKALKKAERKADENKSLVPSASDEVNKGVMSSTSLGNLSAQNYHRVRMLPSLRILSAEARRLQRWATTGEIIIGTSAVLGSILGAMARSTEGASVSLVPICVAVGASVTTVMQQHALYGRLMAANTAVRILSKLDLEWSASSPLEKCSLGRITKLVEETEFARLSFMTAWTNVAIALGRKKGREVAQKQNNESGGSSAEEAGKQKPQSGGQAA